MATVPSRLHTSPQPQFGNNGRSDKQLRRDRITAVLVVAGLLAVLAAVIWLASLTGSAPNNTPLDYWMMR
jgi:hypothetical protein